MNNQHLRLLLNNNVSLQAGYFLDGDKASATDQNTGSNDLSMNPTGPSAAEAASDELNSGRIIAEERQLPGAGCPLKKARSRLLTQVIYLITLLFLTSLVHIMIFLHYIIFFQFL